jgi:hypothetical protein
VSLAAVAASMSHGGCATPPSRSRCATPPRVHRNGPGELLLECHETLVVHLLSGGSLVLDSIARREARVKSMRSLRRFVAFQLGVMPYQIYLLDGLQILTDIDPIFTSPLSAVVAPSESDQRVGVLPRSV